MKTKSSKEFISHVVNNMTSRKVEGSNSTFYDFEGSTAFEADEESGYLTVSLPIWGRLMGYKMKRSEIKNLLRMALNTGLTPRANVTSNKNWM